MTNVYYSSLSGMLAASYGLQNTSNNVANMQSHGFKRTDVFYSSLGNGQGEAGGGNGTRVSGTSINFSDGSHQETQSASDLAIVGKGFFVIRLKNNDLVYTRDGQFSFKNGVLTDPKTGGLVQGYDNAGNLVPIYEKGPKIAAGKASRNIFVHGTFIAEKKQDNTDNSTPTPGPQQDPKPDQKPDANSDSKSDPKKTEETYEQVTFELENIYDMHGKPHRLTFEFKYAPFFSSSQAPTCWEIENIRCDGDMQVNFDPYQQIKFSGTGTGAEVGASSIQFVLDGQQPVTVFFGTNENGIDESVVLENMEQKQIDKTEIKIHKNDGYRQGKQYDLSFDDEGQIIYHYDNDQTIKGIHVGLARFDDMENNLIATQDNFFRAKTNRGIHYGQANIQGFDAIKAKYLERSNVDSTAEFANIVVLQRMFQACSQIMDIDKQLLEELEAKA